MYRAFNNHASLSLSVVCCLFLTVLFRLSINHPPEHQTWERYVVL
jgi:hypothetical protein